MDEFVGLGPDAIERYVGFVSQVNVEKDETAPNIARGKGCWGMTVPDGSEFPGRICTGITRAKSSRMAETLIVGCGENVVES